MVVVVVVSVAVVVSVLVVVVLIVVVVIFIVVVFVVVVVAVVVGARLRLRRQAYGDSGRGAGGLRGNTNGRGAISRMAWGGGRGDIIVVVLVTRFRRILSFFTNICQHKVAQSADETFTHFSRHLTLLS